MASLSITPAIPTFSVYWKGSNADNTLTSTLTVVGTSAGGGVVDSACYTEGSWTLSNTDGLVDASFSGTAVSIKSDKSALKIASLMAEVPLGTYSYSISVSLTENGSGTTHSSTTTFQMTVACPDPSNVTFSIDQSVTVPDLLNKGTNSDISLNGGSAMTVTA